LHNQNKCIIFVSELRNKVKIKVMKKLIEYTNVRISTWYADAKKDYGVMGSGSARFENDKIFVDYTENGEEKQWSMPFYPEYLKEQKIDWVFNCWSELA
jgi:hypothetical protein